MDIDSSLTIWLFGNYTIDTKLFSENGLEIVEKSYGGSVFFGSWALAKFFENVSIKVFSIGKPRFLAEGINQDTMSREDIKNYLRQEPENKLTHYILDYRSTTRTLRLVYVPAETITSPSKVTMIPQIILVTPVYHEITQETTIDLKIRYPKAIISCDPQGWCRERDQKTFDIQISAWNPSEEFLKAVSIVKMSIEDILQSSQEKLHDFVERFISNSVLLIITSGPKGTVCFLPAETFSSGSCYFVPIKTLQIGSENHVLDTTGAGDVWLSVFTTIYTSSKEIPQALASATVLTAIKIQEGNKFTNKISDFGVKSLIDEHQKKINLIKNDEGIKLLFTKINPN